MDGITIPDVYSRYSETVLGVPPEKNGDYAWLLDVLKSLKSNGKAAIILPHGVLFRGNAEADIRKRTLIGAISRALSVCLLTCSMERGFLTASWCWKRKIPQSAPVFL